MEKKGIIGFTSLLAIALIILKLCKAINWSWWWIFSVPLWANVALWLVLIIITTVNIIKKGVSK